MSNKTRRTRWWPIRHIRHLSSEPRTNVSSCLPRPLNLVPVWAVGMTNPIAVIHHGPADQPLEMIEWSDSLQWPALAYEFPEIVYQIPLGTCELNCRNCSRNRYCRATITCDHSISNPHHRGILQESHRQQTTSSNQSGFDHQSSSNGGDVSPCWMLWNERHSAADYWYNLIGLICSFISIASSWPAR